VIACRHSHLARGLHERRPRLRSCNGVLDLTTGYSGGRLGAHSGSTTAGAARWCHLRCLRFGPVMRHARRVVTGCPRCSGTIAFSPATPTCTWGAPTAPGWWAPHPRRCSNLTTRRAASSALPRHGRRSCIDGEHGWYTQPAPGLLQLEAGERFAARGPDGVRCLGVGTITTPD